MPTVLITGANRGLGLEFVRQYAAEGWEIIACCRAPDKADALKAFAAAHQQVRVEALETADDTSIKALAAKLKDAAIDLLINNAGIYSGSAKVGRENDDGGQTFGTLNAEAWMQVLRVNTIAPLMVAQIFTPQLARAKGKLVNITSRMGSLSEMGNGNVAYRSSKAALNAAMLATVDDLKQQGIAVVNLHPGWVQTDMGGKSAPLKPEQSIAGMRAVIASLTLQNTGRFLDYQGKPVAW